MPEPSSQDPRPRSPQDEDEPSWPEKVADILRRIFVPGARNPEPAYVPVPVYVPRPRPRRPA
jgi:hypothetical protein